VRNKESEFYARELLSRHQIGDILDLGAGKNPHYKLRSKLEINQFLVDLIATPTEDEKVYWINVDVLDEFRILEFISSRGFESKISVDCVASLHCIEHLEKKEGIKLLDMMERLATKLVFVETPNGFVHQQGSEDNPWQKHRSGWTVSDFRERGYKVRGISGMKFLKKNSDKGAYKWPLPGMRILDFILSRILNLNYFPHLSFNLVAWKLIAEE
jgi:hypothetical protein